MLSTVLGFLMAAQMAGSLAISTGNCQKNISIKYEVPVTKTRLRSHHHHQQQQQHEQPEAEHYVELQERIRWETITVCCPGFRTLIFGFCEPICEMPCPKHAHCLEPNKCACDRGYEPSHLHVQRDQPLQCRPICAGGCAQHSHCVGHNRCECRSGYRDVSVWLSPLRCERIQCGPEHRYDVNKKICVKIDMTVEELMQKVGERLRLGLNNRSEQYDMDYDMATEK